jgi:hypothetical protein
MPKKEIRLGPHINLKRPWPKWALNKLNREPVEV